MNTDTITTISLSINVVLIVISVALAVASWKDSQKKNSQIKVWMEQANGVQQALQRIVGDRWNGLYSNINDVSNAVWTVQASAFALYQSLYEERILSEKEVKAHQRKIREKTDKEMGLSEQSIEDEPKKKTKSPRKTKTIG